MGYYLPFREAISLWGVDSCALLTRSPLSDLHRTARLACLRHTASVHPEPGSNSQKNCEAIFAARQQALFKPCTNSTRRLEVSCGGQKTTSSIYKIPTTFWLSKFCRTLTRRQTLLKSRTNSAEKTWGKLRRVKYRLIFKACQKTRQEAGCGYQSSWSESHILKGY